MGRLFVRRRRAIALVLLASVAVKAALALYVGNEFHTDVVRAVNFGQALYEGEASIRTHVDRTKTFLGPVLSFHVFRLAGPWGLKLFNLVAFVALFVVQLRICRRLGDTDILLPTLFLFAFYVGGHRNVMAGEPDDMMAALLVATGILMFAKGQRVEAASVLMGLGILFKFWAGIFFGGFALALLAERRGKLLARAVPLALLPFLVINLIDGFTSFAALRLSLDVQPGYTTWGRVGFRLVSTGVLPAVLLAVWTVARIRTASNRDLFLVGVSYPLYILIARDAHAASAVMMLGMVFFSPLIAQFLLRNPYVGSARARWRWNAFILTSYFLATLGLALYEAREVTHPIEPRRHVPVRVAMSLGALP